MAEFLMVKSECKGIELTKIRGTGFQVVVVVFNVGTTDDDPVTFHLDITFFLDNL